MLKKNNLFCDTKTIRAAVVRTSYKDGRPAKRELVACFAHVCDALDYFEEKKSTGDGSLYVIEIADYIQTVIDPVIKSDLLCTTGRELDTLPETIKLF